MFIDEKLNLLVMRDTPEAIDVAARLIKSQDLADPEVTLDVEILEIGNDMLTNLGVRFPDQISASISSRASPSAPPGNMSYAEWRQFNSDMVSINIGDPAAVLYLEKRHRQPQYSGAAQYPGKKPGKSQNSHR